MKTFDIIDLRAKQTEINAQLTRAYNAIKPGVTIEISYNTAANSTQPDNYLTHVSKVVRKITERTIEIKTPIPSGIHEGYTLINIDWITAVFIDE